MYDEKSKKWKRTLLPMPTARYAISVLSLQSELNVVVGGATGTLGDLQHTSVVEVFKSDVKRWYRTDSLQTACSDVSLVAIGNICYAVGGYHGSHGSLNQALYASFDDLLGNAVRGVGRIFMEGFLKRRARSARAKKSKPRPFLPYLSVTAHYSDDLLAGLQSKRSKNNRNSAVLWFINKENNRVRPHLFVVITYLHI